MKRRKIFLYALLYFLIFVSTPLSLTHAASVTPAEISDYLVNPYTGWGIWAGTRYWSGQPFSTAYNTTGFGDDAELFSYVLFDMMWADLEPSEGNFQWAEMDAIIDYWTARGKQFHVRLWVTDDPGWAGDPGNTCVPDWVWAAGAAYIEYWGYGVLKREPDYADPTYDSIFWPKLQNFLTAYKQRYGNNKAIIMDQLMGFGNWGEWHTLLSSYPWPNTTVKHDTLVKIINNYLSVFSADRLVIAYCQDNDSGGLNTTDFLYHQGLDWAVSQKMGLSRHGFIDGLFEPTLGVMQAYWDKNPMIGEANWDYDDIKSGGHGTVADFVSKFSEWHSEFAHFYNHADSYKRAMNEDRVNFENGLKRGGLGYRLVPTLVSWDDQVPAGENLTLTQQWANRNSGWCIKEIPLKIYLTDASGVEKFSAIDSAFDPRPWVKGQTYNVISTVTIPDNLDTGTYDLRIAMVDDAGNPYVKLGIQGRDSFGRYLLGTVEILPPESTIPAPTPTTTSITPNTATVGGGGFTLIVNGGGFVSRSKVQWNGSTRTTTYVSATQLTAAISAADIAAMGTASVTVFNSAPGGGTSGAQTFTISNANPIPVATSLSPTSATAGGSAFTLTVNGSSFVNGSVVRWNGAERTTTFVSSTQLTAAILASDIAAVGTASVTVFNPAPGGGTSGAQTFTISNANPIPVVTSLSPTSATAGGSAFTLTVNGTNFVSGSVVRWNGADRTTTYVSATRLTAAIPAADRAVAGTASVSVFNPAPGGGTSGVQTFTINNRVPTTTSISPTSATAGGSAFTLTVNGTNFVRGSVVRWNGADRTTTYVSATRLTAAIPAADRAVAGIASVSVFNPAPGGGTSGVQTFTINNRVPTTTSISPTSAAAGGNAFTLTVNGTNFVSGSVVRWNGSNRTTTYVSATQLTAAIPASDIATAGTRTVRVFNPTPGGGTSGAQTFTITTGNPVPVLSGLSPSSAAVGGSGFTLTVNGSSFVSGSVVRWNGADRTTTYVSSTQLTAAILAADIAAVGTASVTVFNPTPGGGTSGAQTFTISNPNPVPVATSISPTSATAGGSAFTLTVNGSSFVSGSVVRWNGSNRTTTYVSATQLTASITAADIATTGTRSVTVFNPTPGGGTSGALTFTINNPVPVATSLNPTSAAAGGNAFTLTVSGSSFVSGAEVRWNGADRVTTYVSATQLTASILAADIAAVGTASVTVFNPAPGGGLSGTQTFTITAGNPVPVLSGLSPSSTAVGGSGFTLTVNGSSFVNGSVVRWNGAARTTTYVSATQLTASITAADIAAAGTASVTVFNPTPGGGTSGVLTFSITSTITVTFDSPAPSGSSGSYLNGLFQGINFGTNQWAWEGPYGSDNTNHIYFGSSSGTSRTFTFSPAPQILISMRVFTGISGTLTLTDNLGQTRAQAINTGSMQLVTTGWTQASTTITVQFTAGWELGVDDITYRSP